MSRLLILDFDGTMTDAEQEGAPFREGYLEDLAVLTGLPVEEVHRLAERFEDAVRADPQSFGWIYDGHLVAPAIVDPYLRIMPVARRIFDHTGTFADEADRTRLLDGILYKYNYRKTATAFREGAAALLGAMKGEPVYIVTNSHTDAVRDKVRQLGARVEGGLGWLEERVVGRAKKYVLEPDFEEVAASMTMPGLGRPVLLRRRHYYEVLDRLRREAGAEWSEVTVVGDIFELDLALPVALGARVGLVVNDFTPEYERDWIAAHPRAELLSSLDEVRGFAGL